MDANAPVFEGCSNYTRSEILSKLALAILEERFSNYFHTDNYDGTISSLSLSFYVGGARLSVYNYSARGARDFRFRSSPF